MTDAAARTTLRLCRLAEIEDGAARGFTVDLPDGPQDIFVVRDGSHIHGYVNACPHQGTPLDWTPDQFMTEDGAYIVCATHGALFKIEDGDCIAGPCAGDHLQRVSVTLDAEGCVCLSIG